MTFAHYEFDGLKISPKTTDSINEQKMKTLDEKLLRSKEFRSSFFKDVLRFFNLQNHNLSKMTEDQFSFKN